MTCWPPRLAFNAPNLGRRTDFLFWITWQIWTVVIILCIARIKCGRLKLFTMIYKINPGRFNNRLFCIAQQSFVIVIFIYSVSHSKPTYQISPGFFVFELIFFFSVYFIFPVLSETIVNFILSIPMHQSQCINRIALIRIR